MVVVVVVRILVIAVVVRWSSSSSFLTVVIVVAVAKSDTMKGGSTPRELPEAPGATHELPKATQDRLKTPR